MFSNDFLESFLNVTGIMLKNNLFNESDIEKLVDLLVTAKRENGRLFILGVGGSSANASHAVNDFRKLCNIETYAPTDNVAELTARTNDNGWDSVFKEWLKTNSLNARDVVMVLSVGGGDKEKGISTNLISASNYAISRNSKVVCIVGRDGGEVGKIADITIKVPPVYPNLVTPITEAMQSVILHLIVSHPKLAENPTTW